MTTAAKKPRVGRPMKVPKAGARAPLSLLVRPQLKRRIESLAEASGATLSAEAESLLERALAYDDVLKATGTSIAEVALRFVDKTLRDRGYTWEHRPQGKVYYPPGHPSAPPSSGFVPREEESS
jgi:hypothetical protein